MNTPARQPVQRTRVLVWVPAEVQENGDGTWSGIIMALANRPPRASQVVTAGSRDEVLSLLSERYSVSGPV